MPPIIDHISTQIIQNQIIRYPLCLLYGPGTHTIYQQRAARIYPHMHPADILTIRDYTNILGKTHTLKIENPNNDDSKTLYTDHQYHDLGAREIVQWLSRSAVGSCKIVYIENIHRATGAALNALLKSFEEPAANTMILCTTPNLQNIMDTIQSRAFLLYCPHIHTQTPDNTYSTYIEQTHDAIIAKDLIILAEIAKNIPQTVDCIGYVDQLIIHLDTYNMRDCIPICIQHKQYLIANGLKEYVLWGMFLAIVKSLP